MSLQEAVNLDDNRVLSFHQWCELNGFSPATGRRIINAGNGPIITQLSPRRIGVTVANNDEAVTQHADPPDLKDPHSIKWRLSYAVSQFCGVQIFRSRRQTGLRCIGMPSDVQFAMWLLDTLADFVFEELYAHLIGCLAPPSVRYRH